MRRAHDASRLDFPQQGRKFGALMAVTVLEPMNGKGGAAVDGESPHGPAIIWLLAFNPLHCRHLKVFCASCLSAFVAADGAMVAFNGFSGLYYLFPCPEDGILLFSVCASRCDEQVQSFAVKEFLYVFSRFRGTDACRSGAWSNSPYTSP